MATDEQGALQRFFIWLLGPSPRSTVLGFVKFLAMGIVGLSFALPADTIPHQWLRYWNAVVAVGLWVQGTASLASGRSQADHSSDAKAKGNPS